ncbi:unnamed protein product [Chrysodeixis includens]|uniref:PPM-type phosphatase domain-containing protein n=1 Tax=Chrysodeixis includens TaxID=689277 RepID=A0A9P0C215_CHRIL|nr:unnamed protein product [Chrysodeixis includens]
MGEKEDYLTSYRVFFENFAATVNPEDQLPVNIAGYTITEAELAGEVLYWTTQYLSEKQCPATLMTPLRRIILDEVQVASKKQPNEFGYKSDDSVYIALRLMQAVTARVNDVCLRYLDNSRLDTLPPPPPPDQRDLKTVSCAAKNSRRVMEDRHVEIGNLEALFGIETTEPTSFYAVYDGHAGSAAATYCAAHLHQYLVESPHYRADLRRAMRDAFLRTDNDFIRKSNQERACGGSTAVAVALRGRRLLAAWAGDSLALLAKRMRLMQLVCPHKPDRQDERDRIESSGGTVMYWGTWRVNGQLAVSRAIGDAQYKPYVTARPEIVTVEMDGDEDFVVVACDGLWDFVSEDDVALAVYRQVAADPDDLKKVTKRLIEQAKRQGSSDNISIIVVFLKDPRDIAADNRPPMDLGLDNAMMNAPPFTIETEACRRQVDAAAAAGVDAEECAEAEAEAEVGNGVDNGVDNSDSDSEDLGPETAVDVDADDVDADARGHEPQPPTPPAHAVEVGHVDGSVADNVAESGEDSEDEWNYYKGEGEREEHNPSEEPDELPRSETPCQDNSAWESSSVDMNSSPLNPDAPVFIPGGVAGADVLLAESPRKPMPMDDIELPDEAQFDTGAVVRPAELLDLDNCDQLNGHHNVSLDEAVKEHLNGNDKCNMDSLGFGFNVGIEPDKVKDSGLIQDFERIQKDTTDFCNIQVFQTHAETNPFAVEGNDELFERLKNKERDPMSMSFYQEKDDDTCERLAKHEPHVDLNAVQPLPDSDDEDIQLNGVSENIHENEKENISPEQHTDMFGSDLQEPNNDIIRFDDRPGVLSQNLDHFDQGDNFVDYNVSSTNNIENYTNIEFESGNINQETVMQTDTPESHKLLFEQIPEIPDGKSSELGFTNDEGQDPSESEKDVRPFTPQDETSQDIEMEDKLEDSPSNEIAPQLIVDDIKDEEQVESHEVLESDLVASPLPTDVQQAISTEQLSLSPSPLPDTKLEKTTSPEPADEGIAVENIDIQPTLESQDVNVESLDEHVDIGIKSVSDVTENIEAVVAEIDSVLEAPEIKFDAEELSNEISNIVAEELAAESPLPAKSPLPVDTLLPSESPLPTESPLPAESPLPSETHLPAEEELIRDSPLPTELSLPTESIPEDTLMQAETIQISESPLPSEDIPSKVSPFPTEPEIPTESPLPVEVEAPKESPLPIESEQLSESPMPVADTLQPAEPQLLSGSPLPQEAELLRDSPLPAKSPLPTENLLTSESQVPSESPLPVQSPIPSESPMPIEVEQPQPIESEHLLETVADSVPAASEPAESPLPADVPLPRESPLPLESPVPAPDPAAELGAAPPADLQDRLASPEPEPREPTPLAAAPAPDLLSDQPAPHSRVELVTDVDIGIPESRAQEICVPVTNEIQLEEAVQPPAAATPPPTPAVEPPAAAVDAAPLSDTPIAADAAVAAAAVVAAGAAVAAGVAAAKAKPSVTKKSPTTPTAKPDSRTPRAAPKSATAARTPTSTTPAPIKRPSTATAAARTPTSKAPTPAAKVPSATKTTPAAKPATPISRAAAPARSSAPAARPTPPAKAPVAARSSLTKPAAPKPAPAVTKAAPTTRAAPAPRRRAPHARRACCQACRQAAPRLARRARSLPADRKPLANGDAKDSKPAARPPPALRPARAPCAAPHAARPAAPAAPASRPSAPKPAPRAPLDKQSKDLANKRITAKAAPPRTVPPKTATGLKKAVPKKSADTKKELGTGLSNGLALGKAPPSPPAEGALLPDVIA